MRLYNHFAEFNMLYINKISGFIGLVYGMI